MKKYLFFLFLGIILLGCEEDSVIEPPLPEPAASEHTISNVPADTGGIGKTTYFKFSDSTIVTGSDTTSANWDIAFRSTTILTNSGSSGPGQGGAVIFRSVNFEDVTTASDTGWNVDAAGAPAIPTGSGNGWYNYNFMNNVISPLPSVVLVIKTGDGKYAKVEIESYYLNSPENPSGTEPSRFFTFRYVYQPDGSKNFEN